MSGKNLLTTFELLLLHVEKVHFVGWCLPYAFSQHFFLHNFSYCLLLTKKIIVCMHFQVYNSLFILLCLYV